MARRLYEPQPGRIQAAVSVGLGVSILSDVAVVAIIACWVRRTICEAQQHEMALIIHPMPVRRHGASQIC